MCIHYRDSFCVLRADSRVDQKEKCSPITTLVLFASQASKQDYVSLISFRIILFTYTFHLKKQHLLHSHNYPLQWPMHIGRKIIPCWEVKKLKYWKGIQSPRVQSHWWQGRGTGLGTVKPRFKWNTLFWHLHCYSGIRTKSLEGHIRRLHLSGSSGNNPHETLKYPNANKKHTFLTL